MSFRLLLWLKARLILGSFSRRRGWTGVGGFILLAAVFSPVWTGGAITAHHVVLRHGGLGIAAVFALVHVVWLYVAVVMGAFTEAFDPRRLLRYPVDQRAVYLFNVLAAPLDVAALFFAPPLVAAVLAAAESGPAAGAFTALAALSLVLATSAVLQILLALLGDFLKHEWARAVGGLLIGIVIMAATWGLRAGAAPGGRRAMGGVGNFEPLVHGLAAGGEWIVTAILPVRAAAAAFEGRLAPAALWLAASGLAAYALIRAGARLALRVAMDRETRGAFRPSSGSRSAAGGLGLGDRLLAAAFPRDLAVLVGRELRTYARTPQILIGLCTAPLLVAFFTRTDNPATGNVYWAAFLSLTPALNLSANQFGLDREGVRAYFMLPIDEIRLLLAKNLALVLLILVEAAAVAGMLVLTSYSVTAIDALTGTACVVATLPAILTVGNVLSVRSPWRMTFRMGGAPKGAVGSAFAQVAVLGVMALLLFVPSLLAEHLWVGPGRRPELAALAGIAFEAAAAWVVWAMLLDGAAASLVRRREHVLDALARPEETG